MTPLSALVLLGATSAIRVDPSVEFQTWEGFGTSLAWWAHVIGSYDEPLRTELVDHVIGDLKLNVMRYNIGGGEAPGLHFMESRAAVPGFMSAGGVYDWHADAGQRWVLARAIKLGADHLEAFSNSPPYFMTRSGSVTGAKGGTSNLDPLKVDDFATYLATVVKHFRDASGIVFRTLAPMNEPSANWWKYGGRQEGCHVSHGEEQSVLVLATRRALDKLDLSTEVSASDENSNGEAGQSWSTLSPEAKTATAQVNTHCYWGTSQSELRRLVEGDHKRLWMSEYGDGDASGMTMAHQIVKDLRLMRPTTWVYWQVIDGGGGWGCIDLDLNAKATTFQENAKYSVLAQFSRYIRPGAKFIDVDDPGSVATLTGHRLVIVTVTDQAREVKFDLSRFKLERAGAEIFRTSPSERVARLTDATIDDSVLTLSLPAKSVSTIVVDGCAPNGPKSASQ